MVAALRGLAAIVGLCGLIMAIVVLPADSNDYKYSARECLNQNLIKMQRGVITYPCPRGSGFEFVDFLPAMGWLVGGGAGAILILAFAYIVDFFEVADRRFLGQGGFGLGLAAPPMELDHSVPRPPTPPPPPRGIL